MTPSAGDLLIEAVDVWAQHAMTCELDTCDRCILQINRLRLAYKVWQNSAHKSAAASPDAALLRKLVIAWDADQDEEFDEALAAARAALGFVLVDDHDAVLTQLQAEQADNIDVEGLEGEA